MNPIYLNGKWGVAEEMTVSVLDRGFLFGDGVYEVYRLYGKEPFTRDLHLARLDRSLKGLELGLPCSREELIAILDELENRSKPDSYIYIHVTRGVAPRRHAFPENPKPSLMAMSVQLGGFPATLFRDGVGLRSQPDDRWLHSDIKSLNLLANCWAMTRANRCGDFETLFVGVDGLVNESGASTFYAVVDGVLRTAPLTRNILPGVTRHLVLEMVREAGIPYREEAVTLEELHRATEAFVTNSVFELVPVVRVDGREIHEGIPGPVTKQIMSLYMAQVAQETGGRAACTVVFEEEA